MPARDAFTAQKPGTGCPVLPVLPSGVVLPHVIVNLLELALGELTAHGLLDVARGRPSAAVRTILASVVDITELRDIPGGDAGRRQMEILKFIHSNNAAHRKAYCLEMEQWTALYSSIMGMLSDRPLLQRSVRKLCDIAASSTSDGSSGVHDGPLAFRLMLIELARLIEAPESYEFYHLAEEYIRANPLVDGCSREAFEKRALGLVNVIGQHRENPFDEHQLVRKVLALLPPCLMADSRRISDKVMAEGAEVQISALIETLAEIVMKQAKTSKLPVLSLASVTQAQDLGIPIMEFEEVLGAVAKPAAKAPLVKKTPAEVAAAASLAAPAATAPLEACKFCGEQLPGGVHMMKFGPKPPGCSPTRLSHVRPRVATPHWATWPRAQSTPLTSQVHSTSSLMSSSGVWA